MRQLLLSLCLVSTLFRILAMDTSHAAQVVPVARVDGHDMEADDVRLTRAAGRIRTEVVAPRDAKFEIGVELRGRDLRPLSSAPVQLQSSSTLYYPYDWTWTQPGNVMTARPRLVAPGIMDGDRVYIADTHELVSVEMERTLAGAVTARLLGIHRPMMEAIRHPQASSRAPANALFSTFSNTRTCPPLCAPDVARTVPCTDG